MHIKEDKTVSKTVLIISASPRRGGNSDTLCDRFMQGAQESGHTVEKVFLKDRSIAYCTGCGYCNTHHVCSQHDDMTELIEKLLAADVIVLATPVYFYSMDAQMKTFIDRTTPRYADMKNKEFYFLLTAADTDEKSLYRTMEAFRGFTEDCLEGAKEAGVLYGVGVWHKGEVQATPAYQQAYEMGLRV